MRLGLALPHYDFSFPDGAPASVERVASYARRAEEAGFSSVWVSDHLFLDLGKYGGPATPFGTPEAMTTLAALATVTEQARLGVLVACVPLRHPAILGAAAATVHDASGGRFVLGVGAGWYEPEFAAVGAPFGTPGERIRAMEGALPVIRGALGADGPPVWIGGKGGPRIMRAVAEHADGWNIVWRATPEAYAERLEVLNEACARAGRDPSEISLSVGLTCVLGEDDAAVEGNVAAMRAWAPGGMLDGITVGDIARDGLAGTPQDVAARIKEFEALGVSEIILGFAAVPFSVFSDEQIDLAARALLPLVG